MQTTTILLVILAAIVALGLVLFQYNYKTKKRGKLSLLLSFLRFIGLFGIFLLLINPKFSKNEYILEKANFIVLTDNSSSVANSKGTIDGVLNQIRSNSALSDKFNVEFYNFGSAIQHSDSLSFKEKNTNIARAIQSLDEVYGQANSTLILISDGNSTLGEDYVFKGRNSNFSIYPLAVGDTTQYEDIRIDQVNSNKYAFLKNKYPLEVYVSYQGSQEVNAVLKIKVNDKNVHSEKVKLSSDTNSRTIRTLVNANSVGVKNIGISITPLNNERNTQNNSQNTIVEVIDEKTNIAIVSSIIHPDIGALRKSIESNEQRSVSIKKPSANLKDFEDVDVFVLYQPNPSFKALYAYLKKKKASIFTIGGTKTNWNSITTASRKYQVADGYPIQEIVGALNPSFTKFDITDFAMDDFPPLTSNAGKIQVDEAETLIQMTIFGATLRSPLLFALDNENGKEIVLAGENIWKWRMQSFRNSQNFQNFDDFIGKLMLYLASNKGKDRLSIDYESVYEGGNAIKIKASYFDEAFVFDTNASLVVQVKNKENGISKEIPMLLKNNFYEADLTDISPGQYSFTVRVDKENRSQSGSFVLLDFDVEKQFSSTNYKKLAQLASVTGGKVYMPNETDSLLQNLVHNNQYVPTQKGTKNVVSLIDYRVFLAIIIAALAAEWFIRKYNGLT